MKDKKTKELPTCGFTLAQATECSIGRGNSIHQRFWQTKCSWAFRKNLHFCSAIGFSSGVKEHRIPRRTQSRWTLAAITSKYHEIKSTLKPLLTSLLLFSIFVINSQSQLKHQRKKHTTMTHEYANVNGVKLHYVKAGNGKRLIMFVHGFPELWYEYKNQLQEFSNGDEYTVIAPDMRGYNLSSKPDSINEYQVKYMVEDLRQLSEKLGYKKFTLVAHDWGGMIAWWFAIVHPDYLDKLVIINAPHPAIFRRELTQNPDQQKASAYITFFQTDQAEKTLSADNYDKLIEIVCGPDLKSRNFNEDDKQEYLKAWSQPGALTASLNYYRAIALGPGLDNSYKVNVPTLVIWGEKDKYLMTSNLTGLEEYVPDLKIERFPDGSHWIIHEQPELVNKYIKEFIK